jgi:hypothetical protein
MLSIMKTINKLKKIDSRFLGIIVLLLFLAFELKTIKFYKIKLPDKVITDSIIVPENLFISSNTNHPPDSAGGISKFIETN